MPPRGRRRLPEHRHRRLDARRPVAPDRSTSSSARTTSAPPSSWRSSATLEADGVTVSIGGEIGEVGKENSNEAELRAYLDGLNRRAGAPGARRRRDQQGERPDRHVARRRRPARRHGRAAAVDFSIHERLGVVARREYGLAGHGPARRVDAAGRAVPPVPRRRDGGDPPRDRLPERALRAPRVPRASCTEQIEAWCFANALDERKADQTDQQFVYTTRKKALGPFKRELWDLETKDEILADQAKKIALPVPRAGRRRQPVDGRQVRPPGRVASPDARRARRGRPRRLGPRPRRRR